MVSESWHGLTGREMEVLDLLGDDWTNAQIAGRLVISPETVKSHVGRILAKLGVENRQEAARMYRAHLGERPQEIPRHGG